MSHLDELIILLEQARAEACDSFVVACVEADTGDVVHVTGPFGQAEQALIELQNEDSGWRRFCDLGEEDSFRYQVVPMWGPGQ